MSDPSDVPTPSDGIEIIEPVLDVFEPDEPDETEPIDPEDFAPAPEFSGFEVWCDAAADWAAEWRPEPDGPWFCRLCGKTDHQRKDHEHAGA